MQVVSLTMVFAFVLAFNAGCHYCRGIGGDMECGTTDKAYHNRALIDRERAQELDDKSETYDNNDVGIEWPIEEFTLP